ncbi:MAG: LD-carboxypeptidase [Clostridium sp.]|uniref:LD-carboxypeptidase n=1 Tax=Clostridium sp. TaxID=1506 RepID=UPI003F381BEF
MILKKIALIGLSNPINKNNLNKLLKILSTLNIEVIQSEFLNNEDILARDNKKLGHELLSFFMDSSIDAIFDISGGDLCNLVLPYIDYEKIKNNTTAFFGYSDLTVVLNALYEKSNIKTYNYQILNIVKDKSNFSLSLFKETFIDGDNSLFKLSITPLSSNTSGIVIGGNIRCFLKLSGTPYMPSLKDKILLLESYSGDSFKMLTFLNQYMQLPDFKDLNGIILGNFTEMFEKNYSPSILEIFTKFLKDYNIPIFTTLDIGHHSTAKAIKIGETINL